MSTFAESMAYLHLENEKQTVELSLLAVSDWPKNNRPNNLREVWRNKQFMVQVFKEGGRERLSVIRCKLTCIGEWADGITWDNLMQLKHECGRGDKWAVEIFPPDDRIVNVANMRHLWILDGPPEYAWKK